MHDAREGILKTLNKRRFVTAHLSIFAAAVFFFGFSGLIQPYTSYLSQFAAALPVFVLWSLILPMHAGWAYLRSGAWDTTREQAVREQVLAISRDDDLSAEEAVDLHRRLSDAVRQRSNAYMLLLVTALGHTLLWAGGVGLIILMLMMGMGGMISGYEVDLAALSMLASTGLGILLPLLLLWDERKRETGSVEDYYRTALKRKRVVEGIDRLAAPDDDYMIDDDGEIAPARKQR